MTILASIQALKDSMLSGTILTQQDIEDLIDTVLDNGLKPSEIVSELQNANLTIPASLIEGLNNSGEASLYIPNDTTGTYFLDGVDTGIRCIGLDGANGITPIKGVDYFDGVDGKDAYLSYVDNGGQLTEAEWSAANEVDLSGYDTSLEVDAKIQVVQDSIPTDVVTSSELESEVSGAIAGFQADPNNVPLVSQNSKETLENDWYNPNFEVPVSCVTLDLSLVDNTQHDCIVQASTDSIDFEKFEGENCLSCYSTNSNLFRINPAFSREYLKNKGYVTGDLMRVGLWIKIPDADGSNTRRVYFDTVTGGSTTIIDSSDWTWIEIPNDIVITDDNFIPFQLGVRDQVEIGKWRVKGLTILNVSKNTWVGELKSTFLEKQRLIPVVNQNPYSRYIHENTMLYDTVFQQGGGDFTKEIVKDEFAEGNYFDVVKTTGLSGQRHRVNFQVQNTPGFSSWGIDPFLFEQTRNGAVLKIGFYLKVIADADSYVVNIQNDSLRTDSSFRNIFSRVETFEEYQWFESLPTFYTAEQIKGLDNKIVQVDCTPNSGSAEYYFGGLTVTLNDKPYSFRPEISNNIASSNRLYNKLWFSVGDSITITQQYQIAANRYLGTQLKVNAYGGSCLGNNGAIAYVDANGEQAGSNIYVEPTTGTEGVDYFAIDAWMSSDDRINYIDPNSQFITIMAGTNDEGQGIPVGNIIDTPSNAFGDSYIAALKYWIEAVIARSPNALIMGIHPPYRVIEGTTGITQQYRDAMEATFKLYGLKTVKTEELGVNKLNVANYLIDDDHPNPLYDIMTGGLISESIPSTRTFDYVKEN